jgi:outer membrane receptor for ferrienterochelin and colicin
MNQRRSAGWMGVCALLLVLATALAASAADVKGTVKDASGGALAGARVLVLTAQRAVVATTITDKNGEFSVAGLPDGNYLVVARFPSLAEGQASVTLGASPVSVNLTLEVVTANETVTITANPTTATDLTRVSQPVNVITAEEVTMRAKTVVAQAVDGETGVNLQRTSPGMAGIFVRGLTGNKVNIFVDGVRYSNGAQRGGVNTFLDLIDPSVIDGIEVLRGTSSAQYGSDALGGSVQFLTHTPALTSAGEMKVGGSLSVGGETAHNGGFGAGTLTLSRERFGLLGTFTGRKSGNYRPGNGGEDTHAAVVRFLGLPTSTFLDERMPDTGFQQKAGHLRANWLLANNLFLVANYMSSRQDGANRWDQILGGDGNMIAELNDLELDMGYVRIEKVAAGVFDRFSATYSFNTQREERVNQGGQGDATANIVHQPERTTINGLQFNATRQISARSALLVGGDMYFEAHDSDGFDVNPNTGAIVKSRPRVPDGATYKQGGIFAQTNIDVKPDVLVLTGAVRAGFNRYKAEAADAPLLANGQPMWPDDSLSSNNVTFRVGAVIAPAAKVQFVTAISSGYRAPHMTDLGTLGLTGSGFEVAAPDVAGLNGFVGTTADATARSTGDPVAQVLSEKSLNFDFATRIRTSRVRASVGVFVNKITDNIQKQALILPAGAVGTVIGGQTITSQTADGAVFVPVSTVPVLVRANFDNARVWGVETDGEINSMQPVSFGWTYTYMEAKDLQTLLPPNIEGGTPAPGGAVWARFAKPAQKWWVQPYVAFAAEQDRLSTLDAGDRRTGAGRTRGQIQNFFRRGARNRGWVDAGPDGIVNNADDRLIATGETLLEVQNRVLGVGVNSSPLWTAVPSYTLVGIRFGLRAGPHSIVVDAENLTDESYRGISWGMDGAGRGISVRYSVSFR